MNSSSSPDDPAALSYLELRAAVGGIGLVLPIVLAIVGRLFDGAWLRPSLSAYYYTHLGDYFVGSLCAIGVFLAFTRGYGGPDVIAGAVAGVCAIGVGLFPTTPLVNPTPGAEDIGVAHYVFAAVLFLTLAVMSIFLFRKTASRENRTEQKKKRDVVYLVSGLVILACIAAIGVLHFAAPDRLGAWPYPEFWLESFAIEAFSVAWLTKGEAIWGD